MHISLVAGRKTRGYTRYSPAFISFTVLPGRPLQSTLEPRSRSSRCRPPQREDPRCFPRRRVPPLTRSSLEVPRREASPFRSLLIFVLAFLRHPCILVSVLRYLLLPLTLCSRAILFEPSRPLACNIYSLFILFIELCCDYLTVSP